MQLIFLVGGDNQISQVRDNADGDEGNGGNKAGHTLVARGALSLRDSRRSGGWGV